MNLPRAHDAQHQLMRPRASDAALWEASDDAPQQQIFILCCVVATYARPPKGGSARVAETSHVMETWLSVVGLGSSFHAPV